MSQDPPSLRSSLQKSQGSGELPSGRPSRLWGGLCTGTERCALCGKLMKDQEVSLELEYDGPDLAKTRSSYSVHPRCFLNWENLGRGDGSEARARAQAADVNGRGNSHDLSGTGERGTIPDRDRGASA